MPTTFPPVMALEGPQPVPLDGEAGYLPTIPSDTRRIVWVCMPTLEVFRTVQCTAGALRRDTE